MSRPNIQHAITKYEIFINEVLKEDLRQLDFKLQEVNAEILDLVQQQHTLNIVTNKEIHPNGFKTQVNIGCNFFMEAEVEDTSTLLLNIGLNHFLEFKTEEAVKYLDVRIKAYETKAEQLRQKSAETKAHIKLMLFNISELQKQELDVKS